MSGETKPEVIESEAVYRGRLFDLRIDRLRDSDGEYRREVIAHRGSVVIVPVFDDGTVAMVRQYRHAAGRTLLELCAGTVDEGETLEAAAHRELEEEIGVRAGKLEKLCGFWVSPGFLDEKMHVYLATGLSETAQSLDPHEKLTIERRTLADAKAMADSGKIEDAKTIVGIDFAIRALEARPQP